MFDFLRIRLGNQTRIKCHFLFGAVGMLPSFNLLATDMDYTPYYKTNNFAPLPTKTLHSPNFEFAFMQELRSCYLLILGCGSALTIFLSLGIF